MDHGGAQGLVHELVHWASAVVLVVGGGVALALAWLARRREASRPVTGVVAASPQLPRCRRAGRWTGRWS